MNHSFAYLCVKIVSLVPRVKDKTPPIGTQKNVCPDFDEELEVGSWGPPGQLQNFETNQFNK